jgi:hypothetical protein
MYFVVVVVFDVQYLNSFSSSSSPLSFFSSFIMNENTNTFCILSNSLLIGDALNEGTAMPVQSAVFDDWLLDTVCSSKKWVGRYDGNLQVYYLYCFKEGFEEEC